MPTRSAVFTAVHLIGGALLCLAIEIGSGLAAVSLANQTRYALPLLSGLSLILALLFSPLARRWGRRSALTAPLPLALAVAAVTVLPAVVIGLTTVYEEILAGSSVWIPGLAVVLYAAAWLARAGHPVKAWIGGIVAWLVVLDLGVIVYYLPTSMTSLTGPVRFPAALTDYGFGVLSPEVVFKITDNVFPQLSLVIGIYALSYVIAAAHPTRFAVTVSSLDPVTAG